MDLINFFKHSLKAYLFNKESLDYIDEKVTTKEAFFVSWCTILLYPIFSIIFLLISNLGQRDFFSGIAILGSIYIFILLILFPIFSFIWSGVFFLFLKIFGGEGSYSDTLKYYSVLLIFPELASIVLFLLLNIQNVVVYSIIALLQIILIAWIIAINIAVYAVVHNISRWRVFFVFLAIGLVAFLIAMVVMMLFMSLYSNLFI